MRHSRARPTEDTVGRSKSLEVIQSLVLICASSLPWVSAAVPLAVGQAQYSDRNSAQGDANQETPSAATGFKPGHSALDDIYREEGRCLTGPEIRDDKDSAISCYCRDAILDVRYVY